MTSGIPTKKLFITAIYTSILIGALAIAPHAIFQSVSAIWFLKIGLVLALFIFIIWSINIALLYFTEKYFKNKSSEYARNIISYIICVTIIVLTRLMLRSFIANDNSAIEHFIRHNSGIEHSRGAVYASFVLGFALNTIVLLIQDLILLRRKKTSIELENAELKIKNVEANNQQLKQQIHPHFLFNSLNTLKTLIKKEPDKAEDYLIMLSDFLRASLLSNAPNTVKLNEEIKLCHDYFEMQKMRFGEALQYTINIPDEIRNSVRVPVFSLLPLLENAIKHNKLTTELPLNIQIQYTNGRIITTNNIQPKLSSEPSTGLGLENLSERYRILSGDEIIISNNEKIFSVSIKTLDNENSNYRR
jgi:sensor histidine kinase YesM